MSLVQHGLIQLGEQHPRFSEVWGVEALREPAVDRGEEVADVGGPALVAAEPGEARRCAQLPELGLLLLRDA
jgi:hypothetical protein